MPRCAVDYRLHWFDQRRIDCGKYENELDFIGNTCGQSHKFEFRERRGGIQQ
jgi:hypothetical protein